MDSTKSSCRASLKSLEERSNFRDSGAPSPPASHAAVEPSSPSKRRIRSDALPPCAVRVYLQILFHLLIHHFRQKKSKASSKESSITDPLAILSLENDESSVSSISLDETIESQDKSPTSKAKIIPSINCPTQNKGSDEHNIQLLLDRNAIISQAEEHLTKILKHKLELKEAEINEMREEINQIRHHYNTIVASNNAEVAGLLNSLEYDFRTQEENNAKERARNIEKQERIELLNMIPKLSEVEVMDGQWEFEMLRNRKRYYVDVGKDGIDEFVKVPYSEQRYVDLARHILYLARPQDAQFHGCHDSDSKVNFEALSDLNLDYLSLIKEDGPCWGDYKAVSF